MMQRYEPRWESLKEYTVPEWYRDAKLGIFIHWGVYAVPAFDNEWYPRHMYVRDHPAFAHHARKWGPQSQFGYKDFIPMFKAENWDPAAWVDLFEKSGARYIVPVAEHHDGFPMYDCSFTDWKASKMGPCRDVVGELEQAARGRGLKFGVSSHRAFNWRYYTYAEDFDTVNPANAGLYNLAHPQDQPATTHFLEDWWGRTKELIDRFEPDVLWFDFCWHFDEFEPYRRQTAAYYYNRALDWDKGVVLNYKDKFPDATAVLDIERGKLDATREHYWQTDTSVSVGPRPDGTIPDEAAQILRGLGEWLAVNGEAVYGTRYWRVYGEGPTGVTAGHMKEREDQAFTAQDIRFTTKGDALYAICLGWPDREWEVQCLGSRAGRISAVSLLGSREKISWSQEPEALRIKAPARKPCGHAYAFRITLER
jgi:alpha-L-fucosidase